jgi:hypothetical protein
MLSMIDEFNELNSKTLLFMRMWQLDYSIISGSYLCRLFWTSDFIIINFYCLCVEYEYEWNSIWL